MSLVRGAAITGALTLVSRVLGFVRDLLVARLFGASALADAYFVAFRIPNLLRSFVAEGALNSAFVPVFVKKIKEGTEARNYTMRQALGFVCVLAGSLTLLGMFFSPQIVAFMAPGFSVGTGEKGALTIELTRIMFPLLLCVSLVAAIGGALNSLKIFGSPAMSQIVMNLALIIGALMAARAAEPIYVLAWSVVVGGVAQIIAQIPALRRAGLPILPTFHWQGDTIYPILKLLLPATLGAAVYQGTIFLATIFASLLGNGAVSWLFYADRLTQLPIGIFSIALASVLLPLLAKAHVDGSSKEFNSQLTRSLRYTSFILIPMSVWLWVDAEPLVHILFERGSFATRDTVMTAAAVRALSLGLWAMSCQSMVTRSFIASHDTKTPSVLGLFSLLTYVAVAFVFVDEVRAVTGFTINGLPHFGHVGLALASSVASLISFSVCLLIALRRFSALSLHGFMTSTTKSLGASLLAAWIFCTVLRIAEPSMGVILSQILALGALCFVQLAALWIVRSEELQELAKAFARKLRGARGVAPQYD